MPAQNTLFYGDNLHILREFVADETVDLVDSHPQGKTAIRIPGCRAARRTCRARW